MPTGIFVNRKFVTNTEMTRVLRYAVHLPDQKIGSVKLIRYPYKTVSGNHRVLYIFITRHFIHHYLDVRLAYDIRHCFPFRSANSKILQHITSHRFRLHRIPGNTTRRFAQHPRLISCKTQTTATIFALNRTFCGL